MDDFTQIVLIIGTPEKFAIFQQKNFRKLLAKNGFFF